MNTPDHLLEGKPEKVKQTSPWYWSIYTRIATFTILTAITTPINVEEDARLQDNVAAARVAFPRDPHVEMNLLFDELQKTIKGLNETDSESFYSFHPQDADDAHPKNPLYIFPYIRRNETAEFSEIEWYNEYQLYCSLSIAHVNAGIKEIWMSDIPRSLVLNQNKNAIQKKEPLPSNRLLTFEEYKSLVLSTPSALLNNQNACLEEVLIAQHPHIIVRGLEIPDEGIEQSFRELQKENTELHGSIQDALNAYIFSVQEQNNPQPCTFFKDAKTQELSLIIGDNPHIFHDLPTLLSKVRQWRINNEKMEEILSIDTEYITEHLHGVVAARPNMIYKFEKAGPYSGRSIYMPKGGMLDYKLLQPLSMKAFLHYASRFERALQNALNATKAPLPADQKNEKLTDEGVIS